VKLKLLLLIDSSLGDPVIRRAAHAWR